MSSFDKEVIAMFDKSMKDAIDYGQKDYWHHLKKEKPYVPTASDEIDDLIEKEKVDNLSLSDAHDFESHLGKLVKISDDRLASLIDALPSKLQKTFLMTHFDELTDIEIAEKLGIGVNTPYRQRKEAMKMFKKMLEEELNEKGS